TLETALFKRPMVISYYLSPWMRRIMAWKSGQQRPYLPWVGLPNVLLRDFAVPELLQDDATPDKLAEATWAALTDDAQAARIEARFTALHQDLARDTAQLAARAILEVANGPASPVRRIARFRRGAHGGRGRGRARAAGRRRVCGRRHSRSGPSHRRPGRFQ